MNLPPEAEPPPRRDAAIVATVAAACLFFLSLTGFSLFTLDRIKYAVRSATGPIDFAFLSHQSRPIDFMLAGLATLSVLTMIFAEWRGRAFTRLLDDRFPLGLALVSLSALVWFGHAILAPGLIFTGDAGTHVARVNHLALAIQDGSSLWWDNYFFGGSTLLQFTGPLFHWIAATFQLVAGDPTQAVKYTEFLARLLAASFMFLYARQLGFTRPVATLTMLFYAGSYFITYMEIIRSSFPQLVNFAVMPAILYFIERILTVPSSRGPAGAGLALSAIAFVASHPPTAAIFALFVAAYVICRLVMTGWPMPAIRALLLASVASALGSIYFLVPFALERAFTADNFTTGSLVSLAWPTGATLSNMFVWGRTGFGAEYSTYFGLPMIACVAAGAWLLITGRVRRDQVMVQRFLLLLVLAVATFFARGAYVRHTTLTFLFLCAASGAGLQMLLLAYPHATRLPALIFILFVIDAAPSAIQPWAREDLRFIERAGQTMAQLAPNQRVLEITFENGKPVASVDPMLTPFAIARVQMLSGPHKPDATPAHNAFAAMLKIAEDDLRVHHAITPSTQTMLASVNVGWCVGVGDKAMGLPADIEGTLPHPVFGRYLRFTEATPVLVSSRLEVRPRPESFDVWPFWNMQFDNKTPDAEDASRTVKQIAQSMDVDLAYRQANRFLVPRIPETNEWRGNDGPPPLVNLSFYEVKPGSVHIVAEADRAGFIRLAHPLTPNTSVTRNGTVVAAIPDTEALIVLPLLSGTNDITLVWIPSVLRQTCFWLSMTVIGVLIASLGVMRFRSHRSGILTEPAREPFTNRPPAGKRHA